jgi:hypothetical protein
MLRVRGPVVADEQWTGAIRGLGPVNVVSRGHDLIVASGTQPDHGHKRPYSAAPHSPAVLGVETRPCRCMVQPGVCWRPGGQPSMPSRPSPILNSLRTAEAAGYPALLIVAGVCLGLVVAPVALLGLTDAGWVLGLALLYLIVAIVVLSVAVGAALSDGDEPDAEGQGPGSRTSDERNPSEHPPSADRPLGTSASIGGPGARSQPSRSLAARRRPSAIPLQSHRLPPAVQLDGQRPKVHSASPPSTVRRRTSSPWVAPSPGSACTDVYARRRAAGRCASGSPTHARDSRPSKRSPKLSLPVARAAFGRAVPGTADWSGSQLLTAERARHSERTRSAEPL